MFQQTIEFTWLFSAGWYTFVDIEESHCQSKSSTELKQAQKTLFKAIVIEKRGHNSVWAWLRSDKDGESFQELESLIMGFYVFAHWPSPKRKWTFLIFKTEGSCTTWIKMFAKVRPLPTRRDWETGALRFLVITLKGELPDAW